MTRPLRIQFEGAWYHVMNRGACRKPIFNSVQLRQLFIDLLAETVEIYKIEVHAYCLMDNHFHILIRTPIPNLSKTIQHLSSLYTIRYNKIEGTDGPLFRGRFKSKLVDDEAYGIHLVRYIHLNPLMAHMTDNIENYKWSSYPAYLGYQQKAGSKNWARLIAKVYEVDPLKCEGCVAQMKLIAFINDAISITKILTHLGEEVEVPKMQRARPPPEACQVKNEIEGYHEPEYHYDQSLNW